jgi:HAE1 family hydrophobic/amphiphilic exporter-1
MWVAGFSLNITTLAALSLAVGLLIDDAIVVRESIFKRLQSGDSPEEAAVRGTREVALAVVATTLTVLSVFGPIAFLHGIIGQFFKEFGLTICFAMLISLLDSLTVAPMLSAYFAGASRAQAPPDSGKSGQPRRPGFMARLIASFERYQTWQERGYRHLLEKALRWPRTVLAVAALVFGVSFVALDRVPKSFVPPTGAGEFQVLLDTPPGTSLGAMDRLANRIDASVRALPEVERTVLTVGGEHGESNSAQILVLLKDRRGVTTGEAKENVRARLRSVAGVNAVVQDLLDIGGGAGQPFVLNVTGQDLSAIRDVSLRLAEELRKSGDLKDVDTSYRAGASELRIEFDPGKTKTFGASTTEIGQELRLMLSGYAPARFHQEGEQYDIRVRLREEQRHFDLKDGFARIWVPNLNHRLVPLSSIAQAIQGESPSSIRRENRRRFIEVSADVDPRGRGLAHAVQLTRALFASGRLKAPPGVAFEFAGQTRDFQDLLDSVWLVVGLSVGFMYLVLASLYESFFIPLNIMLVLPLAVCGAFYALFLTGMPLEINSMIGCILLLGVAAKNSILLVDHIQKSLRAEQPLRQSILEAGRVRLRPIMMTTFALIAGMLPVAVPLEEAARQRAGMAVAVIGGLVTSTLLTLVVVPVSYPYLLVFEAWVKRFVNKARASP